MAGKSFIFRSADVEVREREFSILKAGEVLPVEPKAFRLLLILLKNPQKLIPKEELLNAVWGETTVSENSLTRSIALLRKLLGDEARDPRFIETVATVGYRWVCRVEVSEDASGSGEAPSEPIVPISEGRKTGNRKRLWRWALAGGGVLALCLAGVVWYLHRPLPLPRVTGYTQITHDGRLKSLVGTDGSRLYFEQTSPTAIAQVAISGGEIAQVPVAIPGLRDLLDVSPDRSNLLIATAQEKSFDSALWIVPVLGGSFRRLVDAFDAGFSPDGKSIAYSTREGDIFLLRSDGTDARKLASPGGVGHDVYFLVWSPDGGVIRFNNGNFLWEISSNGSGLHQLLPGWHESDGQCCGRWTSDGKYFLFESEDQLWALDERRGLFRKPRGEPIQLTIGPIRWGGPVPAKEGGKIFAEGMTPRGELVRYDAKSGQFQPFLKGISAEFVSFSKDGESVAYVSYPEGILWKASRDGSNPMQLTVPPMYPMNPRWSPDGTQILFMDANSKVTESYIVSSEGGKPLRILPEDDGQEVDPNWSPDGRKIVFATAPTLGPKKEDLRMLDLASGKVSSVPGSTGMYSPRLSSNGRYLAAMSYEQPALWIFEVETQRWRMLVRKTPNGPIDFPQFSRDGKFVYFLRIRGDRGVFRIPVKGGGTERVADLKDLHLTGWFAFWVGFDPTDAPLLLRDDGTSDIYALTLEEK